jgi:hypothetical protein
MHEWVLSSIMYHFLFLLLHYFSIKICNILVSLTVGCETNLTQIVVLL